MTMSKQNKVNPGQYHVAGRLTPDEMARERMKQQRVATPRDGDTPKAMKAGAGAKSAPSSSVQERDRARRLQKPRA
jgi:hypothetical protein